MSHGATWWHGGQDDAPIGGEQRQCRFPLCAGTNLAYQLAGLLKILSSECFNHQVLVIVQGELNVLGGGGRKWGQKRSSQMAFSGKDCSKWRSLAKLCKEKRLQASEELRGKCWVLFAFTNRDRTSTILEVARGSRLSCLLMTSFMR